MHLIYQHNLDRKLPYLNIVSNAMCAAHLEEYAVVDNGEVGVEQLCTHHRVAVGIGRLFLFFLYPVDARVYLI